MNNDTVRRHRSTYDIARKGLEPYLPIRPVILATSFQNGFNILLSDLSDGSNKKKAERKW